MSEPPENLAPPTVPSPPATVEELLPALVELASIQSDLIRALERSSERSFDRGVRPGRLLGPTVYDVGQLRHRTNEVIRFLLQRAGASK